MGNVAVGEFDIVWELFQWSKIAWFTSEDVFTSFRDAANVSHPTYYMMLKKIKEIEIAFHLNPKVFGTHLWRIGGATTMEAAHYQVSMESIQFQEQ